LGDLTAAEVVLLDSNLTTTQLGWLSPSQLTQTGGTGDDTITGGRGADTITGGAGADSLTGGSTGANTFVYTTLSDSIVASYDTIADFKAGDFFKVGHTIASGGFQTATIATSSDLGASLASNLNANNFIANGATLVTVSAGSAAGRFLVINNATVTFSSSADAVIKLSGAAGVANTNFIV